MKNFKDYGFEADFDGEILKETLDKYKRKIYIGYYIGNNNVKYPCIWDSLGQCDFCCSAKYQERNLKPIKKEWYKNPDNFPCLLIDDSKEPADQNKFWYCPSVGIAEQAILFGNLRPATKEEVLDLLVKE